MGVTTAGATATTAGRSPAAGPTASSLAGVGLTAATTSADDSFGIFTTPLGSSSPLAPSQGAVADLTTDVQNNYGAVGVNEYPIWTVPAGQAMRTVSVQSGCTSFTSETGEVPIPAGATTTGSGDSPLIIDQPSSHTEWELWQAQPAGGGDWSACWGGKLDTATSDGTFPSPYGLSASGISYLATTITEADVASGSIKHAIAVQLAGCTAPQIAPADRNDCSTNPGQAPYGTWYRFPAELVMPSGLQPFARMVFRALQRYGMVVTDQAGAVMLVAEDSTDWTAQGHTGTDPITASWGGDQEYQVVADLPWNKLQVVKH
jgi:hypothetical protein